MKHMWAYVVAGIVVGAVGLLWTLQGLNVLGGSAMSGSPMWATIGPIVLVVGLALIVAPLAISRRHHHP